MRKFFERGIIALGLSFAMLGLIVYAPEMVKSAPFSLSSAVAICDATTPTNCLVVGANGVIGVGATNPPRFTGWDASVSTAPDAGRVAKASDAVLGGWSVTSTVAGFFMTFNSTTVPADGAVTPRECITIAANQTDKFDMAQPQIYVTGLSYAFSTTGCFTKTASATAVVNIRYK